MKIYCSDWNEEVSCCVKHGVPQLPCQSCIDEHNSGLQVVLDEFDKMEIADGDVKLVELFPAGEEWMANLVT